MRAQDDVREIVSTLNGGTRKRPPQPRARPRQRQPTNQPINQPSTTRTSHPTRTCKHLGLTNFSALRGTTSRHRKSNRHRTHLSRLSRKGYLLQRPLPATTAASITTHAITKQGLRNQVSSGSDRSSFAVDRQTLFARLGPQRSTADCSAVVSPQNATTRTRIRSTGEISP